MTDHTLPLGPLPPYDFSTSGAGPLFTAYQLRAYALQDRAAVQHEIERLRTALQEADTLMGHDDAMTEWRERWAGLWGEA